MWSESSDTTADEWTGVYKEGAIVLRSLSITSSHRCPYTPAKSSGSLRGSSNDEERPTMACDSTC